MAEWLNGTFYGLDHAVALWVDGLRCGFLDFVSMFMAYLGKGGIFLIVASVVLLLFKNTRKAGVASLLAIAVCSILVNATLKPAVARPRPYTTGGDFYTFWERAGSHTQSEYSFPSGHTNIATAVVTVLFLSFNKKWSWALLLVAPIMALSRIYLGVHYFTDVVGGAVTGAVSGICGYYLGKLIFKQIEKKPDLKFCNFVLNADLINLFKKKD